MVPYPLLFEPILLPKVWGGRALTRLGKILPPDTPIGESWEVADLPASVAHGRSVIRNGELAGLTLRQALRRHGEAVLGRAAPAPDGGFPLLVKYLDAEENLSVQVHPSADYAAAHPEAHQKSEAWVVVEARPGAVIYKGVRPGLGPERFAEDIRAGRVVEDLIAVPVAAGDCHYLPSGTCHALGAGVVVAEIQTPSDTTFRVYDWGRTGRELHVDRALACIDFDTPSAPAPPPSPSTVAGGAQSTQLVQTEHFAVKRIDAQESAQIRITPRGMPMIWMAVSGSGHLQCRSATGVQLAAGTTVLIPAAAEGPVATLEPDCSVLEVTLPPPRKE